jgi:transposase-like protein
MARSTFTQIAQTIPNEAAAYAYLEGLRWPNGPECPHCGNTDKHYFLNPRTTDDNAPARKTRTGSMSQRRVWKCGQKECRKQFSVLTGTVFHGTKVELRTWLMVVFEMCCNKNGFAAREIERKYGVTPKTAWFMAQRLRAAMATDGVLIKMTNTTVVADETYLGGLEKNRHASKRDHHARGRGTHQTPVFTLIDATTGEARSAIIPNITGATLRREILKNVDPTGSALSTDGLKSYIEVGEEFAKHVAVDHATGEYVKDGAGTNLAENFFSQLKRSIDGTHHHVSVEHLPRYLAEFDFRYSTRKMSDTPAHGRAHGPSRRQASHLQADH